MEQQQQHHARRLTPMEVTLEPWSHNNGDYINEIVIDDLDAMDAFDIVPISYNHTPLSRIMFATNYINPKSRHANNVRNKSHTTYNDYSSCLTKLYSRWRPC
ncbi:hypothetical protein P8452_07610 [Trifolium repens]|nr:hypothetical protein P8452_07610 [Trifolium repens]